MFRRYASSLLLAGLLFADGSWLGRLEQIFRGFLGGKTEPQAVWAASDHGASLPPPVGLDPHSGGGSSTAERGVTIDPNG